MREHYILTEMPIGYYCCVVKTQLIQWNINVS